jgi:predicted peptidase
MRRHRFLQLASAAFAMLASSCAGKRSKAPDIQPEAAAILAQMMEAVYRDPSLAYAVPYRLYVPEGMAPSQRYPLVVYLHGKGGSGDDNRQHLGQDLQYILSPQVRALAGPFFVLAPQCPQSDEWINRHQSPPFPVYDQARHPESDASKATFAILATLMRERPIDARRLYLTGPSMGGSGTWDFVTRHPGVFAAAIPVTGVGDPSRAQVIAQLPIWAFHGTRDTISPIGNSRAMRNALAAVGSKVARFEELDGVGHNSWEQAYSQLETYRWLFGQRLSP